MNIIFTRALAISNLAVSVFFSFECNLELQQSGMYTSSLLPEEDIVSCLEVDEDDVSSVGIMAISLLQLA